MGSDEYMVIAMLNHEAWWGIPIGPPLALIDPTAKSGPAREATLDALFTPSPLLQAINHRRR